MTCWVGSSHSSHHLAKFSIQIPGESGNITFVFYLSPDHMIKVSHDFVGVTPSSSLTTLLSLGGVDLLKTEA